jgi:chromosome segregation protein
VYFKKLEIVGFKSFAEKTEIRFEPGVTAIVGPNGCGKSNVADAIRWVLGEQSAKSLRGSSMEDVIFNGSAARDAVNLAEVSLTLDNSSKLLAIDYEEVTITRRLYRSGDSEYLLNKNVVRLKDIHELLLGTGIGTENYSIIEQGKMDRILNSKPDERREIFEEAAGITKFKAKKKEALRKLEQTDANLLRVNDIVVEVKRQIGSIERQAKKAETYKREFEKMKSLEIAVAAREFRTFEDRRRGREDELNALKEQEVEYRLQLETLEEACRAKREELTRVEESLRTRDAE